MKLGVVALDGTKVAADAALAANRSYETIEEEVRRMLAEAQRVDAEEDLLFGPEGARGRVAPRAGATGGASQAFAGDQGSPGRGSPPG